MKQFRGALLALALAAAGPSARALDVPVNPDPGALDAGLLFDASVPINLRYDIVGGLRWLWNAKPLPYAEQLGRLLRAPGAPAGPVEGADVVTFFLQRARLILSAGACGQSRAVALLPGREGLRVEARAGGFELCPTEHSLGRRQARFAPNDAYEIDGFVVPVRNRFETALSLSVDEAFDLGVARDQPARELFLVSVLVHEAAHADFAIHLPCTQRLLTQIIRRPSADSRHALLLLPSTKSVLACNDETSPYQIETFLERAMAQMCTACTPQDRLALMNEAAFSAATQNTPTPAPIRRAMSERIRAALATAPSHVRPDLDALDLMMQREDLPPSWAFETISDSWDYLDLWLRAHPRDDVDDDTKSLRATLQPLLRDLADLRRPSDPPLDPPRHPDTSAVGPPRHPLTFTREEAGRWLERAEKSEDFFVPLKSAIPCTLVPGCINLPPPARRPMPQPNVPTAAGERARRCFTVDGETFCK